MLLHGGAAAADDRVLRGAVVFGPERTIEQDGTFAFRVIVDIAIKVLSRAINDPTTAVLAIDQLHRLLRAVGLRHLHDDLIKDEAGKVRVVFRTPDWEDFVQLSCREIRLYGAEIIKPHGGCAPCGISCWPHCRKHGTGRFELNLSRSHAGKARHAARGPGAGERSRSSGPGRTVA